MAKKIYVYVCYPIKEMPDNLIAKVDYNEAEMFSTLQGACDFMTDNYAQYVMAPELADEEVYNSVKENQPQQYRYKELEI